MADKITNKYFFNDTNLPLHNYDILRQVDELSERLKKQFYAVNAPLLFIDDYDNNFAGFLILTPGRKIVAVKLNNKSKDEFNNYLLDIRADIATLAHKYEFIKIIGRERIWQNLIIECRDFQNLNFEEFFNSQTRLHGEQKRKVDIIISLLLGSINDAKKIGNEDPTNLLDRVKHKIMIFDTDQTRFIYEGFDAAKPIIRIQGLSGTGKTELLLHKLRDLYVKEPSAKIGFTCYNRVLADSLRKRIPNFFNFSKVDRQIEWNSKLWCFHAWGRSADINSGALRYVCGFYDIVFQGYGVESNFDRACQNALLNIKQMNGINERGYAFTYFFIDESQDFSNGFINLIEYVTEKRVYTAGDTFQTIFDHDLDRDKSVKQFTPDYVLNRCYRTAPTTFMFAQALGMGLLESQKLSWMPEESWANCGYIIEDRSNHSITLTREPLRRFDDDTDDSDSFEIIETKNFLKEILTVLKNLKVNYPSIEPNDIAIIFLDDAQYIYNYSVLLKDIIDKDLGWKCNLAYETKENYDDSIFITNRNNVKGLEFPFVICVSNGIVRNVHYRNALYTMLTRSFLKSFLILGPLHKNGLTDSIIKGANQIKNEGKMTLQIPTEAQQKELDEIAESWRVNKRILSLRERIEKLLAEASKSQEYFNRVYDFVKEDEVASDDKIRAIISLL